MERTDVVVVGAGLVGSAIAWRLAQAGRQVILLDRGQPGGEASTAAAGLLQPEAGREAGPQLLQLWLRSLNQYGRFVAELREATGAAFEFRVSGRLVLALTEAEGILLLQRHRHQVAAGIPCELLTGDDARRLEPAIAPEARAALYFPQHGLVDNQRMSPLVVTAAALAGAQVRPDEPALHLIQTDERVEGVLTTRGPIAADVVVNAAGAWASLLARPFATPIVRPAKGEIIALGTRARPFERQLSTSAASISARADGQVVIGSTVLDVGFNKELSADGVARMLAAAIWAIPTLAQARFLGAWTGLRPRTPDDQPIIGADRRAGLFWATGHFQMGILSAPATADVVVALIDGRRSPVPVDELSPRRFG